MQQGPNGAFAYVVGAGGKAEVRPVQTGQQRRDVAVVAKGLNPGETVVVQGQYRLTAGTAVVASRPSEVASSSSATAGLLP